MHQAIPIIRNINCQSRCVRRRFGNNLDVALSTAAHTATQHHTTAAVARYHHTTQSDGLHTRNRNRTKRRERWPSGNNVSSVKPAALRTLRGAYLGPPGDVRLYSSACMPRCTLYKPNPFSTHLQRQPGGRSQRRECSRMQPLQRPEVSQ